MSKKKKTKEYFPEALQHLAKFIQQVRPPMEGGRNLPTIRINLEGLQNAIRTLPNEQRKNIENFWGLTGGPNHSKKMASYGKKDVAYMNMCNSAILSLRLLYKVDYLILYDDNLHLILEMLDAKINKKGVEDISQLERIKYLIAFFLFVVNGPRMFGENDPLNIDTNTDINSFFDEYAMLKDLINELDGYPENSVNVALVRKMLEMLDVKDEIRIKKSLGIKIPKEDEPERVETLQSFFQIRNFKENVFQYGAWNVTTELILGKTVDLSVFMKDAHKISRKKLGIESFKTDEKKLKTSRELRVLDVYTVGGLEFTDSYEVGFLYVERNFIEKMCEC